MRIGIDATAIITYPSGISVYTLNLIRALTQIDKYNNYILFYTIGMHSRARPVFFPQSNFKSSAKFLPERFKRAIMKFTPLSFSHLIGNIDLFHSIDYKAVKLTRGERWIATIHDLIFILFPENITKCYLKTIMDYAENYLPRADYIITDSECSKRDIINILNWPEDRISVVYGAVNFRIQPGARQKAQEILGFNQPYILTVSTFEPRKNYSRLFRAFDRLKAIYKQPIKLVAAGTLGWLYDDIFNTHRKCRFSDDIVILTNVSNAQLGILYSGAEFFVYPSIYEGFGLPILEAQYMGKAVLAGNNSSIPEVVGDSALLVNVKDEEELVRGMLTLLEDPDLRTKLVQKGYSNLRRFSWEKTAQETLSVYERVFHQLGKK